MSLPTSQILNVQITRDTLFPSVLGFGTILFLIENETGNAANDGVIRSYGTIDEVQNDADVAKAVDAATVAFSQTPSPVTFKIGFCPAAFVDQNAFNLFFSDLVNTDPDWYALAFHADLDFTATDNGNWLVDWIATQTKVAFLKTTTKAPVISVPTTNPHILHALQNKSERVGIFYEDNDEYAEIAWLVKMLSVDFETANSTRTGKFQTLTNVVASNLTTNEVRAITGYEPGDGLSSTIGNLINVYVTVGGKDITMEGNMANGEFFDIIHGTDWLKARIQSEVLDLITSDKKIPYTDSGVQMIVERVALVLRLAETNGLIAALDEDNPAYSIEVASVANTTELQRSNRTAPTIKFSARLAGAIHYVSIQGEVTV